MTADLGRVRLLLLDVDGVLTDGSITYSSSGDELKTFHVRDGSAVKLWVQAGHTVAVLSGRSSAAVARRAAELGVRVVLQGYADKAAGFAEILAQTGVDAQDVAAVGDDLPDLAVFARAGVRFAVADAVPEVRAAADRVTMAPGGRGAVREVVETLLKAQGRWAALVPAALPG